MQNLKTPISVSGSAKTNAEDASANNKSVKGTTDIVENGVVDPVKEPDSLTQSSPAIDSTTSINESTVAPSPADSTVKEPITRPNSLRMQWRFWRTLVYFAWLFARIVFWQVYARKYFPDFVERTNTARWRKYARQYRQFAIRLGGVYIKLGQFISTRVDILPDDIIQELESLQDEVPSVDFQKIQKVIEEELGPIDRRFQWIDETPIAAASLGQVHRGELLNGDRVVIKVQRPGIRKICYTDLAAMRIVGRFAMQWRFVSRRADAKALVEEFGRVLLEELSYKHEAYNANRFAEMFKDDMGVYIPSVYNAHSTDRALTLEDVTSIKITDFEAMEAVGVNRKVVAKRLMETYLFQTLDHFFFHADPHPGNLFVYPLPVEDENVDFGKAGRPFYLIFVDFGMTGTLTREIADGLVSTLSAILTRDAHKLVRNYQKLGFLLPDADIDRIIEATEATFDQVWGLSMSEIRDIDYNTVTNLADEFNDLLFSMPFYMPQDFIYLGRTIGIMSGMCTKLDPAFNPWRELLPYTESLMKQGFGIDGLSQTSALISDNLGIALFQSLFSGNGRQAIKAISEEALRRTLAPLTRADDIVQRLTEGDVHIVAELSATHRQQLQRIEKETRRTSRSVFFGCLLITSAILYTSGDTALAALALGAAMLSQIIGSLRD